MKYLFSRVNSSTMAFLTGSCAAVKAETLGAMSAADRMCSTEKLSLCGW